MTLVSAFYALPIAVPENFRISFISQTQQLRLTDSFAQSNCIRSRKGGSFIHGQGTVRAAEVETPIPDEEEEQQSQQPAVSVPVSPSDTLTMFFQAEGTMSEDAIPRVTKVLETSEGVSKLKVQVREGIASVELTKQTTVQATGVASGLVELIQGSGFKLQTLNLSFEDGDDLALA